MRRLAAMAAGLALTAGLAGPARAEGDPLVAPSEGAFEGAEKVPGGQRVALDLGTDRVNWNNARWVVAPLGKARDLSGYTAVRLVVETDRPRADAGVYLALREADGTWYAHPWAANLTQKRNEGLARLKDFRPCEWHTPPGGTQHDENGVFDPEAVDAVAVGCVNPLGVGTVTFVLREVGLAKLPGPPIEPVAVRVTGRLLDVNGTEHVPAGLFGTYAQRKKGQERRYRMALKRHLFGTPGGGDEITHIQLHCWGERVHPSVRLDAGWEAKCRDAARKWADAAKQANQRLYAEFWNEPYLNWANDNRKNFDPDDYDVTRAAEGAPVHIKHDGRLAPHLRWTRDFNAPPWNWCRYGLQEWRRGRDTDGKVLLDEHARAYSTQRHVWKRRVETLNPPDGVEDGETYHVERQVKQRDPETGKRRTVTKQVPATAFTPWHIYDETQFTYWSGAGMLKMYVEPMRAFGEALKEADPDAMFFIGWGFRPSEDHWAGWRLLYKPTLDAGIELADGVHEHDYGGDPLKMSANYEVVQAYAMTRYGKWLKFVNTEQGAQTDPQAYPEAAALSRTAAEDMNKYRWAARKMMLCLARTPGKAFGLCHFGHWWSDHGEGNLFRMLVNLRGRLVQVVCDDPHVYAVAAIDGTDPENPRPPEMPNRKELVVAVWNDHVSPREVKLEAGPATGTRFLREAIIRRVVLDDEAGRPTVREHSNRWVGSADVYRFSETLEPLSMVVVTLPLAGDPAGGTEVRRRQFFGRTVLAHVTGGSPVRETVAVDADALRRAERAWIKFVAERLGEGEGTVTVNGRTHPLPSCITPENAPWIRVLPIDPAELKAENEVVFDVAGEGHAGYLLGMSSLVVEGK